MTTPWDLDALLMLLRPAPGGGSPLGWVAIAAAMLYAAGLVRERRRPRRTAAWRSTSFFAGCVVLWSITGTGVEAAGTSFFSIFMLQQLTLMIVVPSLLVLGTPGRLLLRSIPHRGLGRLVLRLGLGLLRSRAARALLHPVVGIGLFLLTYYGLYLTGAVDLLLGLQGGHLALETLFLVSGVLFALPVPGSDPLPRAVPHGERALDVFVEMGLHAFFGVLIMVQTTPLVATFERATRAAGGSPLADQAIAGGLAWGYGEGPAVLILLVVMHRWFTAETTAAKREDARGESSAVATELEAYNAYLARLASRSGNGDSRPS